MSNVSDPAIAGRRSLVRVFRIKVIVLDLNAGCYSLTLNLNFDGNVMDRILSCFVDVG